ncbi:8622_t:CDS:2, partial [Dentiscutata erythropus]
MDLLAEMKENQRLFDNGEINESEYNERRILILERSIGSIETKKSDSGVVSKSKDISLYEVLQLSPNATDAEIRSSYRKLASKYHPDKNGGVESKEWNKLLEAYKILSDSNSRYLYDNCGSISNSLETKTSLNPYVGGDAWQPYIGNLETGLWIFSFTSNGSSPELDLMNTAEQKKQRRTIRISNIVRYLQDKLTQFPKQDNTSELESHMESLRQEALKLSKESNGKELLFFLGEIYVSKAQTYLKFSTVDTKFSFFNNFKFFVDVVSGYLAVKTKNGQKMNQDEISKVIWKLSRSEISSIVCESCDEVLNDRTHSDLDGSYHLANSLLQLGKLWLE